MRHKIICGKAEEELPNIEDESIDLVLTDPPYNISSDLKIVMKNHPKHPNEKDRLLTYDFGDWDKFESEAEYLAFTEEWVSECYRILKPTGNFVTFFNNWLIGDLKRIWGKLGGRARQKLYFYKKNPKPRLRKVDFQQAIEEMFWGAKSEQGHTFNFSLGQHHNVIESAVFYNSERTGHPTQKPLRTVGWIILYLSNEGDVVFDPFMGSGTTLVECERLRRSGIGVDSDVKWCDIALKRLQDEIYQVKIGGYFEQSTIERVGF